MKILIVEDDTNKRLFIEYSLKEKNIDMYSFYSVKPAIKYAIQHSNEIDGIILDLGLTSYDYTDDYSFTKGLDLIRELDKTNIQIPILINSTTYLDFENLQKSHSNVKSRMNEDYDEYNLRLFINSL